MAARPLRLSTRLAVTHGALVALVIVLLATTLQGAFRIGAIMTTIRDHELSTVDAEEDIHRAAWDIEITMRHGRPSCDLGRDPAPVRASIAAALAKLRRALAHPAKDTPERLTTAAERYASLAEASLEGSTCVFLLKPETDTLRVGLDEEITEAWIARVHEVHDDIQTKSEVAHRISVETTAEGLAVALIAIVVALVVARSTARSVAGPISRLAQAAMRVGEGDFAPIPAVRGPREIEELWRDLERARERLRELDELKQAFLASVSHEMRSPLASLREALALLSDGTCGALGPQQERVVTLARRACEREVHIVETMLDLSRLRSGLRPQRELASDIDPIIDAAITEERDDADHRGVRIEVEQIGRAPALPIDAALVERALANLIRNAVSVSTRGQAVHVIRLVREEGDERALVVEVVDAGPGIDEELRAMVFRPFAAEPVRARRRPAGIGLGLSFAREVARAHGGDLTIPFSSGAGTTFRFSLPLGAERAS